MKITTAFLVALMAVFSFSSFAADQCDQKLIQGFWRYLDNDRIIIIIGKDNSKRICIENEVEKNEYTCKAYFQLTYVKKANHFRYSSLSKKNEPLSYLKTNIPCLEEDKKDELIIEDEGFFSFLSNYRHYERIQDVKSLKVKDAENITKFGHPLADAIH